VGFRICTAVNAKVTLFRAVRSSSLVDRRKAPSRLQWMFTVLQDVTSQKTIYLLGTPHKVYSFTVFYMVFRSAHSLSILGVSDSTSNGIFFLRKPGAKMVIPAGNLYHPRHNMCAYLFQHHTSEGNAYYVFTAGD